MEYARGGFNVKATPRSLARFKRRSKPNLPYYPTVLKFTGRLVEADMRFATSFGVVPFGHSHLPIALHTCLTRGPRFPLPNMPYR